MKTRRKMVKRENAQTPNLKVTTYSGTKFLNLFMWILLRNQAWMRQGAKPKFDTWSEAPFHRQRPQNQRKDSIFSTLDIPFKHDSLRSLFKTKYLPNLTKLLPEIKIAHWIVRSIAYWIAGKNLSSWHCQCSTKSKLTNKIRHEWKSNWVDQCPEWEWLLVTGKNESDLIWNKITKTERGKRGQEADELCVPKTRLYLVWKSPTQVFEIQIFQKHSGKEFTPIAHSLNHNGSDFIMCVSESVQHSWIEPSWLKYPQSRLSNKAPLM